MSIFNWNIHIRDLKKHFGEKRANQVFKRAKKLQNIQWKDIWGPLLEDLSKKGYDDFSNPISYHKRIETIQNTLYKYSEKVMNEAIFMQEIINDLILNNKKKFPEYKSFINDNITPYIYEVTKMEFNKKIIIPKSFSNYIQLQEKVKNDFQDVIHTLKPSKEAITKAEDSLKILMKTNLGKTVFAYETNDLYSILCEKQNKIKEGFQYSSKAFEQGKYGAGPSIKNIVKRYMFFAAELGKEKELEEAIMWCRYFDLDFIKIELAEAISRNETHIQYFQSKGFFYFGKI